MIYKKYILWALTMISEYNVCDVRRGILGRAQGKAEVWIATGKANRVKDDWWIVYTEWKCHKTNDFLQWMYTKNM